jgi:hypothetical protein
MATELEGTADKMRIEHYPDNTIIADTLPRIEMRTEEK